MSRIGRLPVVVPPDVNVSISSNLIDVKGPKGELKKEYDPSIVSIEKKDDKIFLKLLNEEFSAYYGTMRKIIFNMIKGVKDGFERKLEINGVGYRAQVQGSKIVFFVGFSHPVNVDIPPGITVQIDDNVKITLKGCDKNLLGDFAATIRRIRKPEPYLGKGIKYAEEVIKRKVGKVGA